MKLSFLIVGLAVAIVACHPSPSSVPSPVDAADGAIAPPPPSASCAAACATMARIGCSQGKDATCEETFALLTGRGLLAHVDGGATTTCAELAAAATTADVIALGSSCSP